MPTNNHANLERPANPSAGGVRGHNRSLRSKLVLSLAAMFAGFILLDEVVRQRVIRPVFSNLEQDAALRDSHRVNAAIDVELDHLLDFAEQRAMQFEGIELFFGMPSERLVEQSGDSFAWPDEDVHWAAVVGSDQSWHWLHHGPDIEQLKEQFRFKNKLFPRIASHAQASVGGVFDGLIAAPNRTVYAYAAANVVGLNVDDATSSPRYFLIVGKAFDEDVLAELRKRTQVDFSIQVYRKPRTAQSIEIWEADQSTLVVEAPLQARSGDIVANLFVQVPRLVMQQSRATTAVAQRVFVVGVVAALLVMMLQLNRIIVGPVTAIREHTERIAQHGLDAGTLSITSNDEIGQLATAFDHMKNRLTDTQLRLADASHAAGMSQVADTVIHNVGNVLTNVNSLIDTATDRIEGLRIGPLEKLATRLQDSDDVALRSATPAYLRKLSSALEADQAELSTLLTTLHDNVQHIHDVIRAQRRHTSASIDKQRFDLSETVTEAIRCYQARLDQDNIAVNFTKDGDAMVETDRSLLLQILINVIGNAQQAMRSSHDATLAISLHTGGQVAQLRFTDNGCGMTPEVLERVFDAHFTTRPTGSGLGLHFCAIVLKRLDGQITVTSEGPDLGSTFTIDLPCVEAQPRVVKTESNAAKLTS